MPKFPLRTGLPLVIFALALLLTEQAVPLLYRQLPTEWRDWDRVIKHQEAMRTMEPADVLILGDSTAVQGIIPTVFERQTGLKTYNLATFADRSAVGDLALLETYLDTHPAPKAVIIIRSILSWKEGYSFGITRKQFNRAGTIARLRRLGVTSPLEHAQLFLERVFPSLLYREKTAYLRSLTNPKAYFENLVRRDEGKGLLGYEPFNRIMHSPNIEPTPGNLAPFRAITGTGGELNLAPYSLPLLHELCSVTSEHGIPFFIGFNPSTTFVQKDLALQEAIQKLVVTVKQTLSDRPGCQMFQNFWMMEDKYLSDLTHTNDEGAGLFTEKIAGEYLDAVGGGQPR